MSSSGEGGAFEGAAGRVLTPEASATLALRMLVGWEAGGLRTRAPASNRSFAQCRGS